MGHAVCGTKDCTREEPVQTQLRVIGVVMRAWEKYGIVGGILHIISPFLLIWSLNTLFNIGIPLSFRTWLAGLLLIYVIRFHMGVGKRYDPLSIKHYEEVSEEQEIEEPEEKRERSGPLGEEPERVRRAKKRGRTT